jgi:hypothetical protein
MGGPGPAPGGFGAFFPTGPAVTAATAPASLADEVRGTVRVVPEGFPAGGACSDVVAGSATYALELPSSWVKGTLQCRLEAYPSVLAELQKGLAGLRHEPHACFEQASSSTYPNVLLLDSLRRAGLSRPDLERRARDLLARDYGRLTTFECRDPNTGERGGYEWFGGTAPPHEGLTAYGLMQFRDMARVQEVDPAMLRRTRGYLLAQRNGTGSFERKLPAAAPFGRAPGPITDAYVVWALTESGKEEVRTELNALLKRAQGSQDAYFLALVANSLVNRGQANEATALLRQVARAQQADGHLEAERTSITGSAGRDLQIETTALAVLGWLKANPREFQGAVQRAVRWLRRQRGEHGTFGATQATALTLKALLAYERANPRKVEKGELRLYVGANLAARLPFAAGATGPLTLDLPNPERWLHGGRNPVRLVVTGKNTFPCTLSWSCSTRTPASAAGCPVRLQTRLARTRAVEGEVVRLTAELANVSGKDQAMTVAVLGLPAGLALPEGRERLAQLTRVSAAGRPLLGGFEVRGRELVLYWRQLAAGQKVTVPIDLVCRVPGTYRGPASRAYVYYNAEPKHWVEPLQMTITARAEGR